MSPHVIRYRNLSGAHVTVVERDTHNPITYRAGCSGCLETYGSAQDEKTMDMARNWAADHAQDCRALPQDGAGLDFTLLAAEYAERAANALDGKDLTVAADKNRALAAETYAAIAAVYAMLATTS